MASAWGKKWVALHLRVSFHTLQVSTYVQFIKCTSSSSNKMPTAVKQAVSDAAEKYGAKTPDEAKAFLVTMEKEGRLIEECWS